VSRRIEADDDGLNIISEDDEDVEYESYDLFAEGQRCDVCAREDGRIGIDPTCRSMYEGDPVLVCYGCAPDELQRHYGAVEGVAVIIEPFGKYTAHYYYRLDEMPAYQFVREDIEAISWLMLSLGDECSRCGEQSRFAWLTREMVDPRLPEGEPVFRNLDREIEHLCAGCGAAELANAYKAMDAPLITVEVPRSAMGILMPTGE